VGSDGGSNVDLCLLSSALKMIVPTLMVHFMEKSDKGKGKRRLHTNASLSRVCMEGYF
jgi:hypothetical protein